MIEELIKCLALTSHHASHLSLNLIASKTQSNLLLVIYFLSIRKSYLFGAAFFVAEFVGKLKLIPSELPENIFALATHSMALTIWLSIASFYILRTDNKNTLLACGTMILFILFMCWDSYNNAYIETFAWTHYENIVLLIHIAIVLSLYRDKFVFSGLVFSFKRVVNELWCNVHNSYFWYTYNQIKQTVLKK